MRWVSLILLSATLGVHADNLVQQPVLLHTPSPADVNAKVPAKPPVYQSEPASADGVSQETDKLRSNDGIYLAATGSEPDPVRIWDPQRYHAILVIAKMEDEKIESLDWVMSYVRYDFDRVGAQIAWSPDSQYFLMTTTDVRGHWAWHFTAYAYSVKTKTLRCMDPIIGNVIAPSFKFTDPHTVQMSVAPPNGDFAHPQIVNVDLDQKFSSMPEEIEGRTTGKPQN